MDETREDPGLSEIRAWIDKLRKLLALGSGAAIAEAMPGLQKDLQALAGKDGADQPVASQLKTVLSRLAEDMQSGEDESQRSSREDLLKLQALMEDERRTLELLLKELGPVLTPQEASMFRMTLEMVAAHGELHQFQSALGLLNQASLKAYEIADENRPPASGEDDEPGVDLAPLVRSATEALGKLLAPWAPLLTVDFQVQSALFASMLNRCLQEQAHGPALGLIGAWAESVQDLARQLRERILLELESYAPPAQASEAEARDLLDASEKIRHLLSGSELQSDDIQAAQQVLDRMPALLVEARKAVDRRLRFERLWQDEQQQARAAMRRELNKIDSSLHPQVKLMLKGKPAWTLYLDLVSRQLEGNFDALHLQLAQACQGLSGLLASIAQALQPEPTEPIAKDKGEVSDDEGEGGPHELDAIDELLKACPPAEKQDSRSYLQREDVLVFIGENWLSYGARSALSERLDPEPVLGKKPGKGGGNSSVSDEEEGEDVGGGWKVIEDDPRVYFTDSAALDKAKRIIDKVKAGADPRQAATEEGCSTPTWYGNMLEIRLTQGGTQLRLIAENRGKKQLAFTEIKSFHAAGDKKAGKLSNYV